MTQAVPAGRWSSIAMSLMHALGICSGHFLWAAVGSSSRQELGVDFCGCMVCVLRVKRGVLFLTML